MVRRIEWRSRRSQALPSLRVSVWHLPSSRYRAWYWNGATYYETDIVVGKAFINLRLVLGYQRVKNPDLGRSERPKTTTQKSIMSHDSIVPPNAVTMQRYAILQNAGLLVF
jgi:hypothetical protein